MEFSKIHNQMISSYEEFGNLLGEKYLRADFTPLYDRFLEATRLLPGSTILDAGCGPGRDLVGFANRNYHCVGLDFSWAMLDQAKHFTRQKLGKSAPLVRGDMIHLPFRKQSFHAIWLLASMVHFPPEFFRASLGDMANILRDNGYLYFSIQKGSYSEWVTDEFGACRFFQLFKPEMVIEILKETGYTIVDFWESPRLKENRPVWLNFIAQRTIGR